MAIKKRIFTPGPTEVPPRVLQSISRPLIHHRTDAFREVHAEIEEGLRYVFRTGNPVLVLTSSGTGAMEAAVANVTMPGEKVLTTPCGKFSERWDEIARAFGLETVRVEAEWGRPVDPSEVERALASHPDITVVLTTHCETSTGVLLDVGAIAKAAHDHGALIVVDAITGLLAEDVDTDGWGLDVVVGGSQKGFMLPPGLAFISIGPEAAARVKKPGHPVYYFDLAKALVSLEKNDTPYTPSVSLFMGLHTALEMVRAEGLEATLRRHRRNAAAVRAAVAAMGLEIFSHAPCNATTAVLPPEGTAGEIVKRMDGDYGIRIAGGQARLKGKIFRLGHLGYYDESDMFTMISALESVLKEMGIIEACGTGIGALLESFASDE